MPRKTCGSVQDACIRPVASMRPRPDAAENVLVLFSYRVMSCVASMRPRPDAAENALDADLHGRAIPLQ